MHRPKKKGGLIAGLIIGFVLLLAAAAAAVYFFVLDSPAGKWYNAERGMALSFGEDNSVTRYSLSGTAKMTFEYDKISGKGSIVSGGSRLSFKMSGDTIELDAGGRSVSFGRLEKNDDIEEKVLEVLNGIWVCEKAGKALEFDDGDAAVYSSFGEQTGEYTYDIGDGEGKLKIDGTDSRFSASYEELTFDTEVYTKQDEDFDIDEFVFRDNGLLGTWYEESGEGSVSFLPDGTISVTYGDNTIPGTYTFDPQSNSGTATANGQTLQFNLQNDILIMADFKLTRTQPAPPEVITFTPVIGTWYETTGIKGSVNFFEDNSAYVVVNDQIYYGSYTYNQTSGEGQLTINYTDKTETKNFSVTGDTLYLDGYIYTQNYVQQAAGITGTWYSATGEKGIFMFDGLGGVYYEWTGKTYYGSYSFDTATGTGSLTLTVADETETTDFSLLSGQLIIEDEVFIREFVEQVVPQASATEAPPV